MKTPASLFIMPVLAIASLVASPHLFAANAANGDFELPGPGSIGYYGTTPTLGDQGGTGWTFDTVGGFSGIGKPATYWGDPESSVGPSPNGGDFGVLQFGGGFSQGITPGAGLTTVSFYARGNDPTTTIDISLGGTALTFGSGTPISIGNSSWNKYTSVVANVGAGSQNLLFGRINNSGGGNASGGTYIDGVTYQHHIATANYNFDLPASPGSYGAEAPTIGDQGGSGWTFDTTGGNAGVGYAGSYWNNTGVASPTGGNFAYLSYGAGMYQNVTLDGGPVTLSFYALATDDNTSIDIKLGGTALTFILNSISISNTDWGWYTSDEINLIAGTYEVLLGRANNIGGGNAGSGTYLDGIYFTAVPEPSTYMMVIAGLGVLTLTAIRRKRASK
jgi:hypothetical protein